MAMPYEDRPSMRYTEAVAAGRSEPREPRQIERIIEHSNKMREQASFISSKLSDIRRRLLGESDPQSPGEAKLKEVTGSELQDLGLILSKITDHLNDIGRYTESLERI